VNYINPFREILSAIPEGGGSEIAQANVPTEESVTYDEVSEWWDNSKWAMSTYPPSDWHAVMCLKGWDMSDLKRNPQKVEDLLYRYIWGHCEVGDGHVPPTKDPDYSDREWVAWDLQEDGTGNYFEAEVLDA